MNRLLLRATGRAPTVSDSFRSLAQGHAARGASRRVGAKARCQAGRIGPPRPRGWRRAWLNPNSEEGGSLWREVTLSGSGAWQVAGYRAEQGSRPRRCDYARHVLEIRVLAATRFGVGCASALQPKVAPLTAQPWALGRNPVGILGAGGCAAWLNQPGIGSSRLCGKFWAHLLHRKGAKREGLSSLFPPSCPS